MAQLLTVNYKSKPCYDIYITDSFQALPEKTEFLGIKEKKICIVTDSNVEKLYANEVKETLSPVASKVEVFVIPAGEENKNLEEIKKLYQFLIENRYDRKDLLIALGGGVVGDMTGYAAATYLRGIDFIQIPTTLLAQTDSSIGGKTGVDFDGYKNMIGAFKMPRLVYMNLSVLSTLDERQYFSGFAEVMKHGLIKDAKFYTWLIDNMYEICERDLSVLEEMVMKSCNIKRMVVEKDPEEHGDRTLLNYGHTIGHAIEKYMNFSMTHGECVALGAVAAAFVSYKRNLISTEEYYEIRDMFVPFNLPISIDNVDVNEVLRLTKSDKKMEADQIKFVLLQRIGKAIIQNDVSDREIIEAINEINFSEEDARE